MFAIATIIAVPAAFLLAALAPAVGMQLLLPRTWSGSAEKPVTGRRAVVAPAAIAPVSGV
jgi:hypothetical protein